MANNKKHTYVLLMVGLFLGFKNNPTIDNSLLRRVCRNVASNEDLAMILEIFSQNENIGLDSNCSFLKKYKEISHILDRYIVEQGDDNILKKISDFSYYLHENIRMGLVDPSVIKSVNHVSQVMSAQGLHSNDLMMRLLNKLDSITIEEFAIINDFFKEKLQRLGY